MHCGVSASGGEGGSVWEKIPELQVGVEVCYSLICLLLKTSSLSVHMPCVNWLGHFPVYRDPPVLGLVQVRLSSGVHFAVLASL